MPVRQHASPGAWKKNKHKHKNDYNFAIGYNPNIRDGIVVPLMFNNTNRAYQHPDDLFLGENSKALYVKLILESANWKIVWSLSCNVAASVLQIKILNRKTIISVMLEKYHAL